MSDGVSGFHVIRPRPREEPAQGGNPGRTPIVHRGAGERSEIALTFDDGPSPWTGRIAAAFERHGCRATFFLRGDAVEERPETVAALAEAGHELGNHLWSHTDAGTQSRAEILVEIGRAAEAIEAAGGRRPELVRPPYFSAPERVAEAAAEAGTRAVILRSIGSADWQATAAEEIFAPVLANAEAGDIVCLHDGVSSDPRDSDDREPTAAAVEQLVPALLEKGLRPVTVSRLLDPLPSLAGEVRDRLGALPRLSECPPVSAVVVNRNGVEHLRCLFAGLVERTDYSNLELILVDNGSSDGSVEWARSIDTPFPIEVIANERNESFSEACNQGAAAARGELLLFLNNDVEPFEGGWLQELVACLRGSGAGAVAATLLCRDEEHERGFPHGYGVQHRGLRFVLEDGRATPVLRGWEEDPLDEALGEDVECEAVAAACLLIERATFEAVGGFSPGYFYGCEDVDLCLKLQAAGLPVVCSGRSIAIHHPVSTRRTVPFAEARERTLANRRLLWERWGTQLDRA